MPPSHELFEPRDVDDLLSMLEIWGQASFLSTFKLAWKTASSLALVTAKCFSDLTMLHIDNQHPFLQHNGATFIPVSGQKTD